MGDTSRKLCLIKAPINLGLRPLRPGHIPGTWRAPEALIQAGLVEVLQPHEIMELEPPTYVSEPQPNTRIRNGDAIRAFNLDLADKVETAVRNGFFPLVIGGDCTTLLGSLAGTRRLSELSLVHIDGHSDFRHPGNDEFAPGVGGAAGMDLALATGHGDTVLTEWPGISGPLVPEEQTVQLGERENRDPDYTWGDINNTAITLIDVFAARELGPSAVLTRINQILDRKPEWRFWVHVDVDVLDQSIMPAVDSPGSPGIDPDELVVIIRTLLGDTRCAGMNVTIFDPDLDPDGKLAKFLVSFIDDALS
ncbi:arginase family protein [Phyllobacterium myrsinacearum]|uniref:Arginase n=1 Tax=Phyllobacterium myrsinacearum TaxID=28101 RepID=A0A839EY39_9HYPH|nr:arginase family protein [Phyllobacterium myrsinacearum]MBA8881307.1 arginase [Phyllobacterium myrsinacearum]